MSPQTEKISEKENVIICLNGHWIVLIRTILSLIFGWIIFILIILLANFLQENWGGISTLLLVFGSLIILMVHHWFFMNLLHWELSKWIISTKRIISFENVPFITNDVTSVNISEIHEIEKRKHGFIANIFNFGEVHINLAASPTSIIFRFVPQPGKFTNLVESIRDHRLSEMMDIEDLQKIYGRKYRLIIRQQE